VRHPIDRHPGDGGWLGLSGCGRGPANRVDGRPRYAGTHPARSRYAPRYKEPQDMADASFDIVCKVERQEVVNALKQTAKEIYQRYDFKGVGTSISWSGDKILMEANSEDRVKAVLDVFQSKLIKRGVSLKALDAGEPQLSGKEYKIFATIQEGLSP